VRVRGGMVGQGQGAGWCMGEWRRPGLGPQPPGSPAPACLPHRRRRRCTAARSAAACRGTPFCHSHPLNGSAPVLGVPTPQCSRLSLPAVSEAHPTLLNISISMDVPEHNVTGLLGPPATHYDMAHYK
jgi:hypothetical protein